MQQIDNLEKKLNQMTANVYQTHGRSVPNNLQSNNSASPTAPAASTGPLSFATEADAAKANLPNGTPIIINGVSGTWKH